MKRLLTAAALALLMITTAAHADDARVAEGMFAASLYDRDCAKLPAETMSQIEPLLRQIPRDVMLAAIARVKAKYQELGTAKFCELWKDKIERAQ